jgi:uncharacterized protein YndB with AHSA1/START domain
MAGRELTVERLVHAPPERVWAAMTDLEQAPAILRGVTRVEVLSGDGFAVGTRWRETRKMFGKDETQTLEVATCSPPRSATVTSQQLGVDYRIVHTLEPVDGGTLVTICFGATHPDPNLLQRLTATVFGRVGAAVTTRLLSQDLADVAAWVEEPSA